jgi:hypothetical protein
LEFYHPPEKQLQYLKNLGGGANLDQYAWLVFANVFTVIFLWGFATQFFLQKTWNEEKVFCSNNNNQCGSSCF